MSNKRRAPDVALTLEVAPIPKARARVVGKYAYTPRRTAQYEESLGWLALCLLPLGWQPVTDPIRVEFVFYRENNRKCDLDNLVKAALDGLQGVVWKDDNQVQSIKAEKKVDKEIPRVEVNVWYSDGA